jgi:hypothetical protein
VSCRRSGKGAWSALPQGTFAPRGLPLRPASLRPATGYAAGAGAGNARAALYHGATRGLGVSSMRRWLLTFGLPTAYLGPLVCLLQRSSLRRCQRSTPRCSSRTWHCPFPRRRSRRIGPNLPAADRPYLCAHSLRRPIPVSLPDVLGVQCAVSHRGLAARADARARLAGPGETQACPTPIPRVPRPQVMAHTTLRATVPLACAVRRR